MRTRRTPAAWATYALMLALCGCGSQAAPATGPPRQNSTQAIGASPSPSPPTETSPPFGSSAPSSGTSSPTPRPTRSEGIVTEGVEHPTFAIVDQASGDFVTGTRSGRTTLVEIALHGVGTAWLDGKVLVRRTPAGTIARVEGRGHVDRRARWGRGYPSAGGTPVDPQTVDLRLEAIMTPDGLGHADIWIDGEHHRLVATEPPHSADPVIRIVVDDYLRRDWADMYDHFIALPGYSKADFVRLFGRGGSVTQLAVTGGTVYAVRYGVAHAYAPAHLVATIHGRHLDRDVAVDVIYQRGEWRFSTIARSIPGD
jgi:hypothetical protein